MEMLMLGLALGVGVTAFLVAVVAIARAGSVGRAFWGLSIAGRANVDPAFAAKLDGLLGTAAPPPPSTPTAPPPPPKPSGEPIRLLTILQGESRLIDFLMEDISSVGAEQIGTAVKEIHKKAQTVLKQHLTLEPILPEDQESVTVPKGFDPSAIRVVGAVSGEPPYTGSLQHPGWKVREIKLPPQPEGQDPFVIQPAEVQIG